MGIGELPVGSFEPAVANIEMCDILSEPIKEGQEIFVAEVKWYFVPFILTRESVQRLLNMPFV